MATEAEKQVYPLATPSGEAIPYDIGEPLGLLLIDFTSGAATAALALPAAFVSDPLVLWATEDCVVAFGTNSIAALLTRDTLLTSHQFVPANTPVSIREYESYISARGLSASGVLSVQRYRRFKALSQEALQTRIA